MWDAALVSRVRDRKLNEILIFASLAKIDPAKIDGYIDIIVSLGDDIDACDTLLDTEGEAEIELESIDREEYLSRLSAGERADEDCFNSLKKSPPEEEPDENMLYVRDLIEKAVDSIIASRAATPSTEAADRNAVLVAELDAAREEATAIAAERDSAIADLQTALSAASSYKDRVTELEASIEDAVKALERYGAENTELKAKVEGLAVELGKARDMMEGSQSSLKSAQADIERLEGEVGSLKDALARSEETKAAEIEARTASVSEELAAAVRRSSLLEAENARLSDALTESENLAHIKTAESDGLASRLADVTAQLAATREDAGACGSENAMLRSKVEELEALASAASGDADGLRRNIAVITSERDAVIARLAESEAASASLRSGRESLESRIAELESAATAADSLREALSAVKDELRIARQRNEELSGQLDYAQTDIAGLTTERDDALAEIERLKAEAPVTGQSEEPAPEQAPAPAAPKREIVDRILDDTQLQVLRDVRAMKDSKIDAFLDLSMKGKMNENVCDDIISFLKVDIDICDALLAMDYTDLDSIISGFRKVLDILQDAPDARHQNSYMGKLSRDEKILERLYTDIVAKVHDIIVERYSRFV